MTVTSLCGLWVLADLFHLFSLTNSGISSNSDSSSSNWWYDVQMRGQEMISVFSQWSTTTVSSISMYYTLCIIYYIYAILYTHYTLYYRETLSRLQVLQLCGLFLPQRLLY